MFAKKYANLIWIVPVVSVGFSTSALAVQGIVSGGIDTTGSVVANADSDGDNSSSFFAIVVGTDYTGYGDPGTPPGSAAQFQVNKNDIDVNRELNVFAGIDGDNFDVADDTGNTSIGGTLTVTGLATVNGGIDGENFDVANDTGNTSIGGTLTVTGSTTSINSATTTVGATAPGSVATVQAANGSLSINNGVALVGASSSGSDAAVRLFGGSTSASAKIGIEIYGDGQTGTATAAGGVANWADVLIRSQSYNSAAADIYSGSTGGLGSAIVVNDYGVQMVSPSLLSGGVAENTFGSGAANAAGSTVSNEIGQGGAGTVNNTIGQGSTGTVNNSLGSSSSSGTTSNVIGQNGGSGTISNVIGYNTSTGSVTNSFGGNDGTGTATNNFGAGTGATINNIGNSNADTTVALTASGSTTTMSNGVNTNRLVAGPGTGGSVLPGSTQSTSGDSGIVLEGAQGTRHASVNSNGKITMSTGNVQQTTAALVVNNGYGNTHGFIVTESQATISGGTNSSSLTLDNSGATFSNSSNGDPIQVHGVDDGTAPFDAVNVRQLEAGLAQAAALSGLPEIRPGDYNSVGIAFGAHGEGYAIALGGQHYVRENLTLKYGAATDLNDAKSAYSAYGGIGFSW